MTELEDVFGEEFAEDIKQQAAKRREERNRVTQEQMMKICSLAINEGKFDPEDGDPMFTYTTENGLTHQVLLMQVPDPQGSEVWEHLAEPWEGAARLPIEYLGEWYWCTFPDKEQLKKLDQGQYCIVVGSIEENQNDSGEVFKNVYPVRNVATLSEAKEYADKVLEGEGFEPTDQETEESEEEETDVDDFAGTAAEMTPSVENDTQDDEEEEVESTTEQDVQEELKQEVDKADEDTEDEEESEESSPSGLQFDVDDSTSTSTSSSKTSSGGGAGLSSMISGDDDDEEEQEVDDDLPRDAISQTIHDIAEDQDEDEQPQVFDVELGSGHHQRLTTVVFNRVEELSKQEHDEETVTDAVGDVLEENRGDDDGDDEDMNTLF